MKSSIVVQLFPLSVTFNQQELKYSEEDVMKMNQEGDLKLKKLLREMEDSWNKQEKERENENTMSEKQWIDEEEALVYELQHSHQVYTNIR